MNKEITAVPKFQETHNAAIQQLLFSVVLHLHARGNLDGRALIAEIESGQAFGLAAFRQTPNPVLAAMTQGLGRLLDAASKEPPR